MKKNKPKIYYNENGCLKNKYPKVWKFVHKKDFSYKSNLLNRTCDFDWLSISVDGTITVKGTHENGYAWDGCTPKKNFLQITWGNFDGMLKRFDKGDYKPYTYYASMIHDVLYQYKRCVPVTRKETDKIFYHMLKDAGYCWAYIYYLGVRALGWIYRGWKYKSTKEIEAELASKQIKEEKP